jgi:hypothetical protein
VARGLLLLVPLVPLVPAAAGADTHAVPGDFTRITDALAAASSGDTVSVGPGTFSPSASGDVFPLTLNTAGVLLRGAGMLFTTLDAEGQGSVIRATQAGIRITGFTITGGAAVDGGGVVVIAANPEIDNTLITGNTASRIGAGIAVSAGGNPHIHHNVIWGNVDGDTTDNNDPHGINALQSTGTVENNLVGGTDGNGIFFGGPANLCIRNNILYRNGDGQRGRGICAVGSDPSAFVIVHNLFWENTLAPLLYQTAGPVTNFTAQQANDYDPTDMVYGNLDADPLFLDPETGNWNLTAGSPAVDAGDPGSPPDPDGTIADIGPFYRDQVLGSGGEPMLPVLLAGHPNPFSDRVTVGFLALDRALRATVTVFDVRGRRVATLLKGGEISGQGALAWDGRDDGGRRVPPGAYFVRLRSEDGRVSRTVKLLRLP